MDQPELTQQALDILRSGENFQWYVITLLALVMYVYTNEYSKKNWKGIAAGLSLYATHWFFEIINALIQKFTGHALWTVPSGTSFLRLVLSKLLPEDPKAKILGINNRIFFAILNAALFSVIEIFLAMTPAFHWVYTWWGALPVFIMVYIPFFVVSFLCYDWKPKTQRLVIGILFAVDVLMLVIFAGILKWI
jgi:hypothetical protein